MAGNLTKTPIIALFFAALWNLSAALVPFSAPYSASMGGFVMPRLGYAYMVAYGLWLAIIAALVFACARGRGIMLLLAVTGSFIITQWLAPGLPQLRFGETTGVMTFSDTLFKLACGCVSVLLMLILSAMLFRQPPPPPALPSQTPPPAPDKYKIKALGLVIRLVGLPLAYAVLYFPIWYFLLWRSPDVRMYYAGTSDPTTFSAAIVNILLTDIRQIPMALLKGLVYALALLPLLFQLPAKRTMFISASVMLYLGVALQMLIPSPVMPAPVRMAHLMELAAEAVAYGAIASLTLHTCLRKVETPPAVRPLPKAPAAAAGAAGAPAAPAKPK